MLLRRNTEAAPAHLPPLDLRALALSAALPVPPPCGRTAGRLDACVWCLPHPQSGSQPRVWLSQPDPKLVLPGTLAQPLSRRPCGGMHQRIRIPRALVAASRSPSARAHPGHTTAQLGASGAPPPVAPTHCRFVGSHGAVRPHRRAHATAGTPKHVGQLCTWRVFCVRQAQRPPHLLPGTSAAPLQGAATQPRSIGVF